MSQKRKRQSRKIKKDWEKEVLDIFREEGRELRAKEVYEKGKAKGISTITIQRKLKKLSADGVLEHREVGYMQVYYNLLENVRIKRLMQDFTNGVNAKFSVFPEEMSSLMERMANAMIEECKAKGVELPEEEAKKALMENPLIVEEAGFLSFTKAVFEAFKVMLHTKIARHEDFFIDKEGYIVPSAEVYKRFTPSEIEEYNTVCSSDN